MEEFIKIRKRSKMHETMEVSPGRDSCYVLHCINEIGKMD